MNDKIDPEMQMVDGPALLERLWEKKSRPTLRWLRGQTKAKSIPYTRCGRLVFFIPAMVRKHFAEKNTVKARK